MQLQEFPKSVFKVQPPPLWYVTNGDLTVGPVVTGLLMRGVEFGRVPDYCHVRTYRGDWRTLNSVREISALNSKVGAKAPSPEQLAEWGRPIERIKDEMELAHTVTWLAMVTTGAESAMFHYRGRFGRSLVTRSVLGPMPTEHLGYALPESDLVLISARFGRPVFGPPYGPTEDALAKRFAASKGGSGAVAMIPSFVGNELTAMLELSRPGHAFRRSDLQARGAHRAARAQAAQQLNPSITRRNDDASARLSCMRRWGSMLVVSFLLGCGGRGSPPANSSQHELDQRHCTSNSDCASGFCANGRCG